MSIASTGLAAQDFGDLVQKGLCGGHSQVQSKTRGVFGGGDTPGAKVNLIQYVTISTLGNAADFGDLTIGRGMTTNGITSNSIRGLTIGGFNLSPANAYITAIDYVTMATLGNAVDFGDLSAGRGNGAGVASPIRCVTMGGTAPGYVTTIEYVQTMSTGNAVTFGYLNTQGTGFAAGASNGHGGL